MTRKHPHFLLTNDDGIEAEGIHCLAGLLRRFGRVTLLAPDRERSGVSHAFSLNRPLALKHHGEDVYSLTGTPADCVMFGIRSFLVEENAPDYVFSGINHGANLGTDVVYSGTVAGAREGALFRIPSVAVSLATEFSNRFDSQHLHFESVIQFVDSFLPMLFERSLPEGTFLNINVPNIPPDLLKGGQFTRVGKRIYRDRFICKVDEHGNELFWLGGEPPTHTPEEGTDFDALENSMASITPLRWIPADHGELSHFKDWPSLESPNGKEGL
ncbi:MAG: 5'/3'-nucleotidase SurE [Candidatus Omnitrophica bacterium COP1]|nr:5'/3'-nucleotidase SurE [bacterium]MCE7910108.1 5'/3'-nucleotidase SurE [Candidatus Omnitrophica bacterium COP1]